MFNQDNYDGSMKDKYPFVRMSLEMIVSGAVMSNNLPINNIDRFDKSQIIVDSSFTVSQF